MSAYLVSKPTIDAIVALCATERKRKGIALTLGQMNTIGAMLVRANVASIEARYSDTRGKPEEMPGDTSIATEPYRFSLLTTTLTPVAALSIIACYEYQACEVDDFNTSEAGLLCRYLKLWIIGRFFPGYDGEISDLPGWRAAPWGL